MKIKRTKVLILLTSFITITVSCTSQTWYEAAKNGAENNCRNQPQNESERCLENLNKKTYEEYEKERADQK